MNAVVKSDEKRFGAVPPSNSHDGTAGFLGRHYVAALQISIKPVSPSFTPTEQTSELPNPGEFITSISGPRLTMRFQPQVELDPERLQKFQQQNPNVSLQQNPEQITLTLQKSADLLQTMRNFINTMFPRPTPEQRPVFNFDGLGLDAYQKASFERQFDELLGQQFAQPTAAPALSRRQ